MMTATAAAPPLNSLRNKTDELSYKATPKGERKPGLKFIMGRKRYIHFWIELSQVEYDPDSTEPVVDAAGAILQPSIEKLTLFFQKHTVTITGFRLWQIETDCQTHSVDFVRLSSREAVLAEAEAANKPPCIASIKIEKVSKQPSAKPK